MAGATCTCGVAGWTGDVLGNYAPAQDAPCGWCGTWSPPPIPVETMEQVCNLVDHLADLVEHLADRVQRAERANRWERTRAMRSRILAERKAG